MTTDARPHEGLIRRLNGLEYLHGVFDSAQAELETALGVPICVPNCGACCQHNTPMVWGYEVEYIAAYLLGQGEQATKDALDRCEDWLLERHGHPVLPARQLAHNTAKIIEMARTFSTSQCPMLTADRRCSVHGERPMACRAFGVTTYPRGCPRPMGQGEHGDTRAINRGMGAAVKTALTEFLERIAAEDTFAATVGYLPTLLMGKMRAERLAALVDSGRINPVKLSINLVHSPAILWEEQVATFELAGQQALDNMVKTSIPTGPLVVKVT